MLLKKNIPFKYVLGKIKYELIIVAIYSTAIAVIYHVYDHTILSIPLSIPMIAGTVLSLLLAFRSNQAYDRWWEARIIWGAVVNDSRTLARQVLTFTGMSGDADERSNFTEKLIRRQIAWCFALSHSLRKQDPRKKVEQFISKREMNIVSRYDNVPVALLELHGNDIAYALEQGWINQFQHVELDRTITRLCDSMGRSERIKNTVFPATYGLYIHLAMNLFIILLPFGLLDSCGFFEIPLVISIAASFMLIEKMAIHLQDPFENKPTDTPMTTISTNIEKDLKQMMNDHQLPETAGMVKKYFVL
jgi:ion channel-forming bestrophin family protein